MTAPVPHDRTGLLALLPVGVPLSDHNWKQRHRLILAVLALHLPLLAGLGVLGKHGSMMALYEVLGLVVLPTAVAATSGSRTVASIAAALGLLGTSATMVELMGGSTSAHFHFFVSLGFIALYQSWSVYLLAIAYTAVHHVAMAVFMPMHLFTAMTPEANSPVLWSLIHAVFVLAACAAQITFWRFAEASQLDAAQAEAQAGEALAVQLQAEQTAAAERANAAQELSETLAVQRANQASVDSQISLLTGATSTVSGGVSAAAEAVGSIDAAIREISSNVSNASVVANDAVNLVRGTSTAITELSGEVEEIGRLVGAIAGIAAQTNLLALNATIEAARAGDAGKGFAVVAAEVKDLARDTATATETIGAIAGRIQSGTDAALTSMTQVSTVIEQINGYTTTIAAAVEEQSATTAQTRATFVDVADGANHIAEAVQRLASGS